MKSMSRSSDFALMWNVGDVKHIPEPERESCFVRDESKELSSLFGMEGDWRELEHMTQDSVYSTPNSPQHYLRPTMNKISTFF